MPKTGPTPRWSAPRVAASCACVVGFGRVADHEIRSANPAGILDRQVVDAKMDAVRITGEGNVDPVVDQEQRLVFASQRTSPAGKFEHLAIGPMLAPELNGGNPAIQGRFDHRNEIARRVIRVGNQIQAELCRPIRRQGSWLGCWPMHTA